MDIQLLNPNHASMMARLYKVCFADAWDEAFFTQKLNESAVAYGCFNVNQLVGFIFVQIIGGEAEILTFCVDENYRGKGIGASLLKTVLEQSKNSSCFLEVNETNIKAIRLYERIGFQQIGVRSAYYSSVDGNAQDAIIYRYSKKVS